MDFILFIHSSVGTPLGWCHALAVVSHAEIQVDMQPALRYANVKLFVHIIRKRCWILLHFFSTSFEMIVWLMSFIKLMWCIIFIGIHMLNYPCIASLGDSYLIMLNILFICYCVWLLIFYWEFFISAPQGYWPIVFFFLSSLFFLSLCLSHTCAYNVLWFYFLL